MVAIIHTHILWRIVIWGYFQLLLGLNGAVVADVGHNCYQDTQRSREGEMLLLFHSSDSDSVPKSNFRFLASLLLSH